MHIFTKTNANQAFQNDINKSGKALLCFALPCTLPHYQNLFSKNGSEFSKFLYLKNTHYALFDGQSL